MVSTTEVAKYAGVSQTTVSRVLNKPDQVKKATYDKVMNAVNELGYVAEKIEQVAVPMTKTKTISLIIGAMDDALYTHAIPSIVNYAQTKDYVVNMHFIAKDNEVEVYETIFAAKPSAIMVISTFLTKQTYENLIKSTIPFVVLNSSGPESRYSIGLNDVEAGYLATQHLIDSNHIEIAWVGGPLHNPSTKDRLLGFVQGLQAANHKIRKKRIVVTNLDNYSLYESFESLQALKKKPTAIVAATDEIAIQLLDFYKQTGFKIPEDLSIIGIGNSEIGQHTAFELTSVGTTDSIANLGQEAVKRLFDLIIDYKDEDFHVTRDVELFKRTTTADL